MSRIAKIVRFVKSLKVLLGIEQTPGVVSPYFGARKGLPNGDSVSFYPKFIV